MRRARQVENTQAASLARADGGVSHFPFFFPFFSLHAIFVAFFDLSSCPLLRRFVSVYSLARFASEEAPASSGRTWRSD